MTGTISAPVNRVWINKTGATLNGSNFTAANVLLDVGENTLYATALTVDENVSVRTTTAIWGPPNVPPSIQIVSPATGSQVADVTPLFDVVITDSGGFDWSTFAAYLDGVDKTTLFTKDPPTGHATWQPPDTVATALHPGMHTFQVTIKDVKGFTNTATSTFRITGPVISFLQPDGTLYIFGNGFGTASNTVVFFTGASSSSFTSISATLITLAVPSGATDGPLHVEVNGVASEPVYFDRSFPGLVTDADWVAIDAQDRVYYVDNSDRQRVWRIPQAGGSATNVFSVSGSEEILGLTVDHARTTVYVVTRGSPTYVGSLFTYSTGRIYSVDLNGTVVLRKTLLQDPVQSGPYSDPGGIDVVGSVAYITAFRPDSDKVVLAVDLNTGATSPLISYPLTSSSHVDFDVKVDSAGNIYTQRNVGGVGSLYKNSGLIYNLKNVGALHLDCLDRVWFTDLDNSGAFDGGVYRLQGLNSATPIATGTNPQRVSGIDADSTGNVFIGSPDFGIIKITTQLSACEKDFAVHVTGDVDKILADYDPVQSVETPDSQFVVLTACLSDAAIPRSSANRVEWTYESDPRGITNLGSLDGPAAFTFEPGYTLDGSGQQARSSYDGSGCSKVRFHPTDAPGDNFRVAALAETVAGNASSRSRIMTVWKRVHVELDSMTTVTGPLDPQGDDALIGDVPDPDPGLLVAAFKAAYIDVVLTDAQNNTPDVAFDTHVPDTNTDLETVQRTQHQHQAALGRASESATGDWWVYVQGAYECFLEKDHDPNPEEGYFGFTDQDGGKASLVYFETARDVAFVSGLDEIFLRRMYVLHEIGHQFGLADDTGTFLNVMKVSVMQDGELIMPVPYFLPSQIMTLRCRGSAGACAPPANLP